MDGLNLLENGISEIIQEVRDLREADRITHQLVNMSGCIPFRTFCKIVGIDDQSFTDLLNELGEMGANGSILDRLEKLGVTTSRFLEDEAEGYVPKEDDPKVHWFTGIGALYFYHTFMSPLRDKKNIPIYSIVKTY